MKKQTPKKLTTDELKELVSELKSLQSQGIETKKPLIRRDCPNKRPCAFVSCRYNTYLDVDCSGNILYNHKDKEPWEVDPELSCTLDIASKVASDIFNGKRSKGLSNKEIGEILGGVSRETIRLMAITSKNKLKFLYNIDEDSMSIYEEYKYTFDEVKSDLNLKDRIFFKWVNNGLAYSVEDGIYMISLQSLHDYFNCNYRDFYCLTNLSDSVVEKYKLDKVEEYFNA